MCNLLIIPWTENLHFNIVCEFDFLRNRFFKKTVHLWETLLKICEEKSYFLLPLKQNQKLSRRNESRNHFSWLRNEMLEQLPIKMAFCTPEVLVLSTTLKSVSNFIYTVLFIQLQWFSLRVNVWTFRRYNTVFLVGAFKCKSATITVTCFYRQTCVSDTPIRTWSNGDGPSCYIGYCKYRNETSFNNKRNVCQTELSE